MLHIVHQKHLAYIHIYLYFYISMYTNKIHYKCHLKMQPNFKLCLKSK